MDRWMDGQGDSYIWTDGWMDRVTPIFPNKLCLEEVYKTVKGV